ncbi:odorant receptor 13a-like, partial [Musca vetustissima]|uniref:odorant receptor 13a-like n=1 Tax=Musca vetustissima TaxID=27455 RepID=UPI002AB71C6C
DVHPEIYKRAVRRTKPTLYISLFLWVCLVIYLSYPIIIYITKDHSVGSTTRNFPFPTVFPYDVEGYWNYIFTYAFLSYVGYIVVSLFYAIDALLAYFISFVAGQFEILHADIARLIPECHAEWLKRYGGCRGGPSSENSMKLNCLQEMYTKRLHRIAARHKEIIKFCKELENFLSFPLFANYSTSTFLICFVGFQFIIAGRSSFGDFMKFLMFFLAVIGQLFVVCKLGNLLITQSTDTAFYLFSCNWEGGYLSKNSPLFLHPEILELESLNMKLPLWKELSYYPANRNFRQKLMFMIMRSNRPVQLSVMQFTVLSLQSFNRVVSNSLSYFALLKSFMDK